LRAAEQRRELSAYAAALEHLFLAVPVQRGLEDAVIGNVFGAMERRRIDFSGAALRFLARNQFNRQSLFYLEMNIKDAETLHRLAATPVSRGLEGEKQLAIENIKRRLSRATTQN
jgi:hypothetical protein